MSVLRVVLIATLVVLGALMLSVCADAGCALCGHICCTGVRRPRSVRRMVRRMLDAARLSTPFAANIFATVCVDLRVFLQGMASAVAPERLVALRI